MNESKFPYLLLFLFILISSIMSYNIAIEFFRYGFSLKLLGLSFLALLLCLIPGSIFLAFYTLYKRNKRLFEVCTIPSQVSVVEAALSSHNVGGTNPTFLTVEFGGTKKTFQNVGDDMRFKYKTGDSIDILYNPNNSKEFIFV
ncbi:MAG: hypothetical protein JXR16_16845 [Bermanella sp.]